MTEPRTYRVTERIVNGKRAGWSAATSQDGIAVTALARTRAKAIELMREEWIELFLASDK